MSVKDFTLRSISARVAFIRAPLRPRGVKCIPTLSAQRKFCSSSGFMPLRYDNACISSNRSATLTPRRQLVILEVPRFCNNNNFVEWFLAFPMGSDYIVVDHTFNKLHIVVQRHLVEFTLR